MVLIVGHLAVVRLICINPRSIEVRNGGAIEVLLRII